MMCLLLTVTTTPKLSTYYLLWLMLIYPLPTYLSRIRKGLYDVLCTFRDVFATTGEALGCTSIIKHAVKTTGPPIRQAMHRLPVALKDTVQKEVKKMLDEGVICPSSSPWSSPLVMVRKKDNSWRFCVDYHNLNSVTHRDAYPLPRIDATLDFLSDCSLFTTLDLASGYWQVEVAEPNKEKTASPHPRDTLSSISCPLA